MQHSSQALRIVLVGADREEGFVRTILNGVQSHSYFLCLADSVDRMTGLTPGNEFDVILADLSRLGTEGLALLARIRALYASTPLMIIVEKDAAAVASASVRFGALKIVRKSRLSEQDLEGMLGLVAHMKESSTERHFGELVQRTIDYLQQQPVTGCMSLSGDQVRWKPLSELMPQKFLELTQSYTNLLDVAVESAAPFGKKFSGHNVSRQLSFLASDLGSLRAGVWDVIDIHTRAVGRTSRNVASQAKEQERVLVGLMTALVSYYRTTRHANA